jgi:hypothetical protein
MNTRQVPSLHLDTLPLNQSCIVEHCTLFGKNQRLLAQYLCTLSRDDILPQDLLGGKSRLVSVVAPQHDRQLKMEIQIGSSSPKLKTRLEQTRTDRLTVQLPRQRIVFTYVSEPELKRSLATTAKKKRLINHICLCFGSDSTTRMEVLKLLQANYFTLYETRRPRELLNLTATHLRTKLDEQFCLELAACRERSPRLIAPYIDMWSHVGMSVSDIEKAYRQAKKKGEAISPIEALPQNKYMFLCREPSSGQYIEVTQFPGGIPDW